MAILNRKIKIRSSKYKKRLFNRIFISGLQIENFKSFGKKAKLEFAPKINLIFGKNSAGKSTIFQVFRLIRQSYEKGNLTPLNFECPDFYKNNGGINFNLSIKDLVFNNNLRNSIGFGIETNVLSRQTKKILKDKKGLFYNFNYKKDFYKSKNIIPDKNILTNLNFYNENLEVNLKSKYEFLEEGSKKHLYLENIYQHGAIFFNITEQEKIEYKSIYQPYYYELLFGKNSLKFKYLDNYLKVLNTLGAKKIIKFFDNFKSYLISAKGKKLGLDGGRDSMFDPIFRQKIDKIFNKYRDNDINKVFDEICSQKKFFKYLVNKICGHRHRIRIETDELLGQINLIQKFLNKKITKTSLETFLVNDFVDKNKGNWVLYKNSICPFPNINNMKKVDELVPYLRRTMLPVLIGEILFCATEFQNDFNGLDIYDGDGGPLFRDSGILDNLEKCMKKTLVMPGLRTLPSKYNIRGLQTSYVGTKAENIAEILINPKMQSKVNEWMKKLEIPYKIGVKKSENYYELVFKTNSNVKVSQTHVGLGYPLILPFIIQCLLSKNQIILIEEPEVHLHPKLEADLADLIIYSSNYRDNQFFIETHSEDFLLRLLKNVRKKNINNDEISINYISKENKTGSKVEKININSQGSYKTSWKDGLFSPRYKEYQD